MIRRHPWVFMIVGLVFLATCLGAWMLPKTLQSRQTPAPSTSLKGTLLLQKFQGDGTLDGFYEYQAGLSSPRPATELPFDQRTVTDAVSASSAAWGYVVFGRGSLLDSGAGTVTDLTRESTAASTYRIRFSPNNENLAYWSDVALYVRNLPSGETNKIYESVCGSYTTMGRVCGQVGGYGWLTDDRLLVAHYSGGVPGVVQGPTLGEADKISVFTPDGSRVASWDSPEGADYYVANSTVVRDWTSSDPSAWLDPRELAHGLHEPHPLAGNPLVRCLSPSGDRVVAYLQTGVTKKGASTHDDVILEVRTGEWQTIGGAPGPGQSCHWSPDESQIVWADPTVGSLWLAAVGGGKQQLVQELGLETKVVVAGSLPWWGVIDWR